MKKLDLTGQRFGMLTVVLYDSDSKKWKCKCDCGNLKAVSRGHLKDGHVKSCGCFRSERAIRKNYKHGFYGTRIYKIYFGMIQRCENPNNPAYGDYGGRGIKICEEWRGENGFLNFYRWAMQNGYSDVLSIDRKLVNGNYEPNNCRWATQGEQCNNVRRNIFVGKNTLKQECVLLGLNYNTVYMRIKRGWSVADALSGGAA